MNSPYSPPESRLSSTVEDYRPGIGWKILFFFLLPLEVWSQYEAFTVNEYNEPVWFLVVNALLYAVFYVGLFGLAFAKKIGTALFWRWFLPVLICLDVYQVAKVFSAIDFGAREGVIVAAVVTALLLPLLLFCWYAIFRYQQLLKSSRIR